MDLFKFTPGNLMFSPFYKNVYPANIWNHRRNSVDTAPVQSVATTNVVQVCPECGNHAHERPMTNADVLAIGLMVVMVIGLFVLGFKNIFDDDDD